jgi:ankyrin repeat protein/L-ascorbate metabolism protein UlaG (beta-lactamase superfamily)
MNYKILVILVSILLLYAILFSGDPDLCKAVKEGDLAQVKDLVLADKGLLKTRTERGQTPLHLAAGAGNQQITQFLIDQGADIDALDDQGNTPLHTATALKQIDCAEYLLAKGADVTIRNGANMPVIVPALTSGSPKLVGQILDAGQDVNENIEGGMKLIHGAAVLGDVGMAKILIDKGADINAAAEDGITPMFMAVYIGNSDLVELLISCGVDMSYREKPTGRSLLHLAALKGIGRMVSLLIDSGCDLDARDKKGKTPFQYAAKYGHKGIADLLLEKGARAAEVERDHGTPYLSQKPLKSGQAVLWFLGNSGWAVKTQSKFLIFDFATLGGQPDEPALVNGSIDPDQIRDQSTYVFVTHHHNDHFSPEVFAWKNTVKNITYILGFKPEDAPEAVFLNPRERKTVDGMEITTIASTDAGVGFLVKVDGLTIFHAGDHACREKQLTDAYTSEIDYLAAENAVVDIALLPIMGCGFRDPEAVKAGIDYALEKLRPKTMLPMHATGYEYKMEEFVREARKKKSKVRFDFAEIRGDCLFYEAGKLIK